MKRVRSLDERTGTEDEYDLLRAKLEALAEARRLRDDRQDDLQRARDAAEGAQDVVNKAENAVRRAQLALRRARTRLEEERATEARRRAREMQGEAAQAPRLPLMNFSSDEEGHDGDDDRQEGDEASSGADSPSSASDSSSGIDLPPRLMYRLGGQHRQPSPQPRYGDEASETGGSDDEP